MIKSFTLKYFYIVFLLGIFLSSNTNAQTLEDPKDSVTKFGNIAVLEKIIEKDFIDITKNVFTKLTPRKFRHPILATDSTKKDSSRVFFAFLPAVGYALQTGLTGIVAINISFFTTKKNKDIRLSSFTINPAFSFEHHQVMVPIQSNIWLSNNKINLLGDWRYYLYPTYTYGLGGQTALANNALINYSFVRIYQVASKKVFKNFYAGLGYGLDWHFDVSQQDQEGLGTDFLTYNRNNRRRRRTVSSGPMLTLTYDSRNNINNPQTGNYANITVHSNLRTFGSNRDWQSLQIDLRKFIKLSSNGRHVLTFWNYNWFTFGSKAPYFDLPSTGWDTYSNTGRGYIQGRLRGTNMLYAETEYRFTITKNGLFGGVVFANAESVTDYPSNQFTTILPAAGLGIRLKINKISRVNFALDYAWGVNGSRGFFFNLSEVF